MYLYLYDSSTVSSYFITHNFLSLKLKLIKSIIRFNQIKLHTYSSLIMHVE